MHGTSGVLFVDPFLMADPRLRTALGSIPTLKLIVETELYKDQLRGNLALIFVHELNIADTLTLIARLKARHPAVRILVAFQTLNATALHRLLGAGVDAFVMNHAAPEEFHAALTALAQSNIPMGEPAVEVLSADITPREVEILRFLSAGFSNKDVARRLNLSVRTVETHRLNLRRKTRSGRLNDLVSLARHLRLEPVLDARAPNLRRVA